LLSKNIKIKIYRTVILPFVLYGCESWSLTLRQEHKLRVFENRMLRKMFGFKKDKVVGEWRKLHNEELNNLYSSPNIIRMIKLGRMRWEAHVARMGKSRSVYMILVGKYVGKKPLGRPRHGWKDNTKICLQDVRWGGMDWLDVAQDFGRWRALVDAVMDHWVP